MHEIFISPRTQFIDCLPVRLFNDNNNNNNSNNNNVNNKNKMVSVARIILKCSKRATTKF